MSGQTPDWYVEIDRWQLRLWVCTPCLDDQCLWCPGAPCRCGCNDESPAELALADRVWALAGSVGKPPPARPAGDVAEVQELRRAVLEAEMREAYGHLGEAARDGKAAA